MSRIAALLALLLTPALYAQSFELAPFASWQEGGRVRTSEGRADFDEPVAFGVFLSSDRGEGRMLDVLLSNQTSEAGGIDVSITYLQLGGRYTLRRGGGVRPYIALTAGAAHFGLDGDDTLRPAGSGGGGVDLRLSERLALRLDGRFFLTMLDAGGEIGCRGGGRIDCVVSAEGSRFVQFAASAGLVMRF